MGVSVKILSCFSSAQNWSIESIFWSSFQLAASLDTCVVNMPLKMWHLGLNTEHSGGMTVQSATGLLSL